MVKRIEVVQAEYSVAELQKTLANMKTDEARSTGDQDFFLVKNFTIHSLDNLSLCPHFCQCARPMHWQLFPGEKIAGAPSQAVPELRGCQQPAPQGPPTAVH